MLDGVVTESLPSVLEQISTDLSLYLNSHSEPKKFIKIVAQKTGVHEKTLQRLLNQENRPNYMTVLKIYRLILGEFDDSKVLEKAPLAIRKYLSETVPQKMESGHQYSPAIDLEIQKNPVFAEIYILAGTGGIKKKDVALRFGKYGLDLAEQMLSKNTLIESSSGDLLLGPNQASFTTETILAVGIQLSQNYAKPKNAYEMRLNHMGISIEGLSEVGFQKWIAIDEEAFAKKVELIKKAENLGPKRAFTFMVTDTLEPKGNI